MKVGLKSILIVIVVTIVSIQACVPDAGTIETKPLFYHPDGFPATSGQLANNPVTYYGFNLGKKLFYDPILSVDSTISCASCHQQFAAFAHMDHKLSHGVHDLVGTRNTPPLFNLAWHSNFFWDGGSTHIEMQPIGPITNPVEMSETLAHVLMKLRRSNYYPTMFERAFGNDTITTQGLTRALAQYMSCLISANSKYDQVKSGTATFTPDEQNGYLIFKTKCESCHQEPLMTDLSYRNNGLDEHFLDPGRARITLQPSDSGKFKVPSLRNIAVTYPYMHDGRLNSLSKVIDHYRSGIVQSSTIDPILSSGNMTITDAEKQQLILFLNTLTDPTFLNDKRFSEK
ncbi:MAG: cytochrome-c peroxidase [Bacteroidota bacterium]